MSQRTKRQKKKGGAWHTAVKSFVFVFLPLVVFTSAMVVVSVTRWCSPTWSSPLLSPGCEHGPGWETFSWSLFWKESMGVLKLDSNIFHPFGLEWIFKVALWSLGIVFWLRLLKRKIVCVPFLTISAPRLMYSVRNVVALSLYLQAV